MLVHRASAHPISGLFTPSTLEQLLPLAASIFVFNNGTNFVFRCRLGCSFRVRVPRQEFNRGHHELMGHLFDHVYEHRNDRTIVHIHNATLMYDAYVARLGATGQPRDPQFPVIDEQ